MSCVDGAGNATRGENSRVPDIPVVLLVAQASRLHVQPGRLHHKTTRMGLPFVAHASRVQDGKFEIRNSKFEISVGGLDSEFTPCPPVYSLGCR